MHFARILSFSVAMTLLSGCVYNDDLGENKLMAPSVEDVAGVADGRWRAILSHRGDVAALDAGLAANAVSAPQLLRLKRVAGAIIAAAGEDPATWDVRRLENSPEGSNQADFIVLPKRRLGVSARVLDALVDDTSLAVLIAHGVAHLRYNHANERFRTVIEGDETRFPEKADWAEDLIDEFEDLAPGESISVEALDKVLGLDADAEALWPFALRHEIEADRFALRYMKRAGFSLEDAADAWAAIAASGVALKVDRLHPGSEARWREFDREAKLLMTMPEF